MDQKQTYDFGEKIVIWLYQNILYIIGILFILAFLFDINILYLSWSFKILLITVVAVGLYLWRDIKGWSEVAKKQLHASVWIAYIVLLVLVFYVNWYMPHGEIIYTGEVYSESGREYIYEDMRDLDIPEWAKFLRANTTAIFIGGILVAVSIDARTKKGSND